MDLRQLNFFLKIAKTESFTKAAEQLHIAQPALSIAIRKLEEELDVLLLNRQGRKITLTPEGEALMRHALVIQQQVRDARQELDDLHGLLRGEVRVGITPMLGSFLFPQIISSFKHRYPELQLFINSDSAWNMQRKIAAGKLDIAVVAGDLPKGLDSHLLVRDEVVACVHRTNKLATRQKATMAELLTVPLIHFTEGYHLRELIDERASAEGVAAKVVAESNLFALARGLVKEELGLAFFPKMVIGQDNQLATISCDPPLFLDLVIAWRENAALSRANRLFVDYIIQEVDDYYLLTQAAASFPLP